MYEFLEYRVENAITRELVAIAADTALSQAQKGFESHDSDVLPVLADGGSARWSALESRPQPSQSSNEPNKRKAEQLTRTHFSPQT